MKYVYLDDLKAFMENEIKIKQKLLTDIKHEYDINEWQYDVMYYDKVDYICNQIDYINEFIDVIEEVVCYGK